MVWMRRRCAISADSSMPLQHALAHLRRRLDGEGDGEDFFRLLHRLQQLDVAAHQQLGLARAGGRLDDERAPRVEGGGAGPGRGSAATSRPYGSRCGAWADRRAAAAEAGASDRRRAARRRAEAVSCRSPRRRFNTAVLARRARAGARTRDDEHARLHGPRAAQNVRGHERAVLGEAQGGAARCCELVASLRPFCLGISRLRIEVTNCDLKFARMPRQVERRSRRESARDALERLVEALRARPV